MSSEHTTELELPSEQSTDIFATVFEYANDAIFIVDIDNDSIVECNPAAESLVGHSREELLSMPASDLHPHNFAEFESFAERVFEEGSGWTDDITCYHTDGEIIPAEMSASVVELNGRPHLINQIRETSDCAERDWFKSLIEHGTDVIIIVDADGSVRFHSESMGRVFGHENLQDDSLFEFVHPDDKTKIQEIISLFETNDRSAVNAIEFRLRRGDGSWAWVEGTFSHQPEAPVTGYVINARDVTARKENRQQAAVLNRMLRHNLRNGLNVVIGHAEQFAKVDQNEIAASAETVVSKAWELYNQASYAKELADILESGNYTQQPHNLTAVVESVVNTCSEEHPDVEFEFTLSERLCVMAAPRLDLAIEHVVRNAAEHNDAAAPKVTITVQTPTTEAGYVELTVTDNGPGIPKDEQDVLLDGEETPLKHGSGLGLWIVNWIITRTGGRLAFNQNDPRGSRVTLALPAGEQ